MYTDGVFESDQTMFHPLQQLPEDVMILKDVSAVDEFLSSRKDLALFEVNFPKFYQSRMDAWIANHTIEDYRSTSIRHLTESVSSTGLELIEPFSSLVKRLAPQTRSSVRLTIKGITDQMCPLFHIDNVFLRFIVTLKGPGTLWLQNKDVIRKNLGKGGRKPIVRPQSYLQQVRTGQVAILKGARFPGSKGLVHKSPAVDPHSGLRLMVRLDFS